MWEWYSEQRPVSSRKDRMCAVKCPYSIGIEGNLTSRSI
jgi:hypothetical protein